MAIKELFKLHGKLAGASWGILVPLAMSAAWFRESIPVMKRNGGTSCGRKICSQIWLFIHATLTSIAAIMTSVAVYFVVKALSVEGGYEYARKLNGPHQTMGLFLFIGVWVQVLGGIMRPKSKYVKAALGATDEEATRGDMNEKSGDDSATASSSSLRVVAHKWRKDMVNEQDDVTVLTEVATKSIVRKVWDYGDRILAAALLICGFWQLFSGPEAYQERYGDDSYLQAACMVWVGVFWCVVIVLTCFLKKF